MCSAALDHALLDCFAVASSRDGAHADQFRESILKAAASFNSCVGRAIFDDDDLLQHFRNFPRQRLDKVRHVGLEVRRLIVGRNYNADLHQMNSFADATADSIESSMLV